MLGLYDPDRSQSSQAAGCAEDLERFRHGLGPVVRGPCAPMAAQALRSCPSPSPLPRWHASHPSSARVIPRRFGRPTTPSATRTGSPVSGQATGRDVDLMLRLDRAAVILALDADPLLTDPEMIRHARGFADGRRAGASGGAMNRLYAVEGVYSLTGTMADHRLRLESRQIARIPRGPGRAPCSARGRSREPGGGHCRGCRSRAGSTPLAKDLLANRGRALIVAGERQPAAVHAAVCALNTSLGNTGTTVSYYETRDAALPSVSSLASLVSAMQSGTVQTLVVLGGNPVFDAPADLDFAAAMAKVPHAIALGHAVDETSAKAEWHIPRAHYLESWGDARAVGGTLSVVQPLHPSRCSADEPPLKCWG